MNVYDFDETIYDGDSTVDFVKYSIIHQPKVLIYFPKIYKKGRLYIVREMVQGEQLDKYIKKNGLTKEELSRLFDKIVVFDKNEITKEEKDLYNLNDMMYNELYENGGLAFHLKFMYPQAITNRRM